MTEDASTVEEEERAEESALAAIEDARPGARIFWGCVGVLSGAALVYIAFEVRGPDAFFGFLAGAAMVVGGVLAAYNGERLIAARRTVGKRLWAITRRRWASEAQPARTPAGDGSGAGPTAAAGG
jgi:hypothetical protein